MTKKTNASSKKKPAAADPLEALIEATDIAAKQPAKPRASRAGAAKSAVKGPAKKTATTAKSKAKAAKPKTTSVKPAAAQPKPIKPKAVPRPAPAPPAVPVTTLMTRIRRVLYSVRLHRIFAAGSLVILLVTTVFWSLLSARLQQANADQVVDAYLFQDHAVFQGANFPGAHSFLLKWPLFALMARIGFSPVIYHVATVCMTLAAVGFLAYLLWRACRRPAVFGTVCLALASVLLLVPAQPYPGALLPVNMAMTTARNLEYVAFAAALLLASRLRMYHWTKYLLPGAILTILIASDKLFAVLAVGAGMFALALAVLRRQRQEAAVAGYWIITSVVAFAASTILLLVLSLTGITNIVGGDTATPFSPVTSLKQVTLGAVYGMAGLLTNFGANPVHGTVILQRLPHDLLAALGSWAAPAYILNLIILMACLYGTVRVLAARPAAAPGESPSTMRRSLILLVGAALASLMVFVATDHYYPVDARYLTISLFALAVGGAAYVRSVRLKPAYMVAAAALVAVVLPVSAAVSWREYHQGEQAGAPRASIAAAVSDQLERHHIGRLIGNYWDITPAKSDHGRGLTVSPLSDCVAPSRALSSQAWYKPSGRTATAYLAVKDGSPYAGPDYTHAQSSPTYGGCSLARIVSSYGTPSERIPLGNSKSRHTETPDALLLLYPQGIEAARALQRRAASEVQSVVQPLGPRPLIPLSDSGACAEGTTLQVVAHQDDDLLFMTPDLMNIHARGRCLRTVYLTAGDAGEQVAYWGSREKGAKAAYASLYKSPNAWNDETQMVAGKPVTVSTLAGSPGVSLVFLRLPDGNLHGEGFPGHKYGSMSRLISDVSTTIQSVDQINYSKQDLNSVLLSIMNTDATDEIRTLGSDDWTDGDHPDHHAAGKLVEEVGAQYDRPHSITHYLGYPDKVLPVNLSEDDMTAKQSIFLAYAKFDGAVCQTAYECLNTFTYGHYLQRQYPLPLPAPEPEAPPAEPAAVTP